MQAPGKLADLAPVYRVKQFREKPQADVAAEYLASGNFYWNSGIFVWRASTIIDALRERQPEMYAHLQAIEDARGSADFAEVYDREFKAIKPISIDFAVMEQAEDVAVIEAPFDWDDVGSWQAIARLHGVDEDDNAVVGKHLGIRSSGCVVRTTPNHLVATLGLKDVLVVHTPAATLVADKHDEEAVREIVKKLESLGWADYL